MLPDYLKASIDTAAKEEPACMVPEPVPGRILHVDADYLVYWAAVGSPDMVGTCRHIAINRIDSMKTMSGAERVVLHLTDRNSHKGWRSVISKTQPYQDQRKGSKKPTNWDAVRTWLEQYSGPDFIVKSWSDREADDAMSYASSKNGWQNTVIATKDKDMRMIPALHLVWDTFELVPVTPDTFGLDFDTLIYGRKWFWLQMLIGDSADFIPGVQRGFGKVAAAEFLSMSEPDTIGLDVLSKYLNVHGDAAYDRFVEVAMLLWLRTDRKAAIDNVREAFIEGGLTTDCPHNEPIEAAIAAVMERVEAHAKEINRIASQARQAKALSAAELCRSVDW